MDFSSSFSFLHLRSMKSPASPPLRMSNGTSSSSSSSDAPGPPPKTKSDVCCILDARCGLCHFLIDSNDEAIGMLYELQAVLSFYAANIQYFKVQRDAGSAIEIPSFKPSPEVDRSQYPPPGVPELAPDWRVHLCFHNLCRFYRTNRYQAISFHRGCLSFAPSSILPSPPARHHLHRSGRRVRPAIRPTVGEMREQEYFLQRYRLQKLPPELWLRTMPLCLRELSIAYYSGRQSMHVLQQDGHAVTPRDGSMHLVQIIDLSAPVFARYTTLYGKVYLQSLGNVQIPGSQLRSDATSNDSEPPLHVAVGFDHSGVRHLRIVRAQNLSKFEREATPVGLWWKTVSGRELRLEVQSDVSCLHATSRGKSRYRYLPTVLIDISDIG